MTDDANNELEIQIQALLCNELDEQEQDELLARIVNEESVRRTLKQMLLYREAARAALGYDAAREAMRTSMTSVLEHLEDRESRQTTASGPVGALQRPHARWTSRLWPVAALVAVAASVYLGLSRRWETDDIRREIHQVTARLTAAQVTASDRAVYRRLWNEVAVPSGRQVAWILMEDGRGRFEYLPAVAPSGAGPLLMLRCLIVSEDGEVVEKLNLLVPQGQSVELTAGGALGGTPLQCSVISQENWVTIGVNLGDRQADAVGVTGKAYLDRQIAEVGRFRAGDRDLTVLLQAVTLEETS